MPLCRTDETLIRLLYFFQRISSLGSSELLRMKGVIQVGKVKTSTIAMLAGIVLITLTGLIHLIDAPDSMSESALKGLSFYANFAGAVVAAVGIAMRQGWAWTLGVLVAAGAFTGYIISRTVGIFGIPPDVWLEPLGIASLLVDAGFVAVALRVLVSGKGLPAPGRVRQRQ